MITSAHNPKMQRVRALLARRQEREQEKAFAIEGVRLVEEALLSEWLPQQVFYCAGLSGRGLELLQAFSGRGIPVEEVAPQVMDAVAGTEASQGLLAVLPTRPLPLPERLDFLLVADNLRDPGNLGTLLRTAAAAGVQAVLLTPGTADAFSPKVLRAGMGAHFRLPVHTLNWQQIVDVCHPAGSAPLKILLAEAGQGTPCWQLDLRQPVALITGGEAEGASAEARQAADEWVTIPMPGRSESLNAAVAAAVILFEVVRQRSK